jgi:hypothetical protein
MKYPELHQIHWNLPQLPAVNQSLKLIPIPTIQNLDFSLGNSSSQIYLQAEHAAIQNKKEYDKANEDLIQYLAGKRAQERRKQEAFSKVLVPEKTASLSDLSLKIAEKQIDVSEFEELAKSASETPTSSDFKLLKEIIGLKDMELGQASGVIQSGMLPAPIPFNRGLEPNSLGSSPQSFAQASPPKQSPSQPHLAVPSKRNTVPKIKSPSPSKAEFFQNLPLKVQTFESLCQMGFSPQYIPTALRFYESDQDVLDFLTILQDCPPLFCNILIARGNKKEMGLVLKDLCSIVELGFDRTSVAQALFENSLNKADALESLLKE